MACLLFSFSRKQFLRVLLFCLNRRDKLRCAQLSALQCEAAKLLIERGADVNAGDQRYLLGYALASSDPALAQLMVQRGADTSPLKDLVGSEGDAVRGGTDCAVCMQRERSVLLHPCMHLVVCSTCANKRAANGTRRITSCPVCRKAITRRTAGIKLA